MVKIWSKGLQLRVASIIHITELIFMYIRLHIFQRIRLLCVPEREGERIEHEFSSVLFLGTLSEDICLNKVSLCFLLFTINI